MSIELRVSCMALLLALMVSPTSANTSVPAPAQPRPVVISGADIHRIDGPVIRNGRLRFENGELVAVGGDEVSLAGADLVDGGGKHVYPGFIAANSVLGLIEIGAVRATDDQAEVGANSANVRAEVAVNPDSELIPVTRANGVLLALSVPQAGATGVIAGTSALLQLDGWTWEDMTVRSGVALHIEWPTGEAPPWLPEAAAEALRKAVAEKRKALERAFDDANAYAALAGADAVDVPDLRLRAMLPFVDGSRPVFIHADDAQSIEEALAFAARRDLQMVLVGGLEAWRVADALRQRDIAVIIGGTHTLPMRRSDPVAAVYANAARLADAGVRFAIATSGDGFDTANLRNLPHQAATAVAHGLSREEALRAITLHPAQILGVEQQFGSLAPGKQATLFLANGDPLDVRTTVERAWIGGREIDLRSRHTRLYDKYRQKYPETADSP